MRTSDDGIALDTTEEEEEEEEEDNEKEEVEAEAANIVGRLAGLSRPQAQYFESFSDNALNIPLRPHIQ